MKDDPDSPEPNFAFDPHPRRGFMAIVASALSALLGIVPASLGGLFFLEPAFRKQDDNGSPFVDVGVSVGALPEDGPPQLATAMANKVDTWSGYPNQAIGTVWLRKVNGQVVAFNTVCPHLGCSVEHRPSENDYFCPCHTSNFDIDGERLNAVPPRGMDRLEVKIEDGRILVKYEDYRVGQAEKILV